MRPFRNDLTADEIRNNLLRQARVIGVWRSALKEIATKGATTGYGRAALARIAREALKQEVGSQSQ